jgi:hypothetical protein
VSLSCSARKLLTRRVLAGGQPRDNEVDFSTFDLEVSVAFFLGMVLFIVACGYLDTRLSWPPRPIRGRK